jgi:hypothetical protein
MERTALKLDPLRFAVGKKAYDILIDECHVPQIEHQRLPRRLDDE